MHKQLNIILIALTLLLVVNQQLFAQCDSTNTDISDKIKYLGGWDSNGRPDYLEAEIDSVSDEILNFVDSVLPESVDITESGYFEENVRANTILKDTAKVYTTYVHEGAAWHNAFGFYTYDVDNPPATYEDIDSLNIVFPNVDSANALNVGDQVYLGEFLPNTAIGYFVIAKGWNGDTVCLGQHIVFTDKHLNTITDPEYRQHSVLLNNEKDKKLLLGIEDQLRPSGDKDFNDIVFHISSTPEDAIDTTDVPKIPTAHLSGDTILCNPEDTANLKVELTGTSPWTLVYNNGSEDITIENIQDSIYTIQTTAKDTISLVSVEDDDGMGIVSGSAIIQLAGTDAQFNSEMVVLCESTSGQAKINLSGIGPYDLKYSDGNDTTLLSGIADNFVEIDVEAGNTYTLLQISDQYCSKQLEDSIDVTEGENPEANVSGGGIVCSEADQLNAEVEFQGIAPFTFVYEIEGAKDTIITSSNPLQIGVGADSTLTPIAVSDANCDNGSVSGSASVTLSPQPTATLSGMDTVICENDSALLKIDFEGITPFNFEVTNGEWSNSYESSDSTFTFYAKQPGNYVISTFSDSTCQGEAIGEVEVITDTLSATVSGGGAICESGNTINASIDFAGSGPFHFVYDLNSERDTTSYNNSNTTIELNAGDELVPVMVFNNTCSGTVSGSASASMADKPEASFSENGTICGDGAEKNITITFTGQAPFTYKYLWNQEEVEATTSEQFVEIKLTHNDSLQLISLEDANCIADINDDAQYKATYYQSPTATISGSTNICDGTMAEIIIQFTGNGPWTTELKNGDFTETIVANDEEFIYETDMTGTFELVSVSDAHCDGQVSGEATIGRFEKPTATLNKTGEICGESEEITVELTFTGKAPFHYQYKLNSQILDASTTNEMVEIVLGNNDNFELSSFEDANCKGTISNDEDNKVIYHQAPTATISGNTNICNGSMAKIKIEFSGNGPWVAEIVNGNFSETVTSDETEYTYETDMTGTFELKSVSDAKCTGQVSGEATIGAFDEPTAKLSGEASICGDNTALLTVSLTGDAPFTFELSNGNKTTEYTTSETEYSAEVNEAGTYTISYIEDDHCTGTASGSAEVQKFNAPTATISGGGAICGDEKARIQITLTGEGPFSFEYTDGQEVYEASTIENSYTIESNTVGTYTLVSLSDLNCEGTVSGEAVISNAIDDLEANIEAEDNYCENNPIDLSLSIDGEFNAVSWSSNGDGTFTNPDAKNTEYAPAEGTSGTITFFVDITTECGKKQISKDITIIPLPAALFNVETDELIVGEDIVFNPESGEYDSYTWNYGDGTEDEGVPGNHVYDEAGIYTVSLTVTDNGCANNAELDLEIILEDHLYVPNVFNPEASNPDNRVVKVYGVNVSENDFSFKIVNRWGNVMYTTNSFTEANSYGWDGREINNEEMQELSSFTYILKGKFKSGESFEKTGTITLLR